MHDLDGGTPLPERHGQALVVRAIPEHISKAFSKGRQQILNKAKAYTKDHGLDWDGLPAENKMGILRDAGAEGRLGKMKTDERNIWREQAAALGWQHRTAMEGVVHERLSDGERFGRAYEFAARHLAEEFHTAAVIEHEKLGMYAARRLIGAGIAGGPDDITRVVKLLEEAGHPAERRARRPGGASLRREIAGHQHHADPHRAEPG
jgi:hypothetical protein